MANDCKFRNILDLAERVHLIKDYEITNPKPDIKTMALKYGVSETQIKSILLNQEEILIAYDEEQKQEEAHRKRQEKNSTPATYHKRLSLSLRKRVKVIQEYKSRCPPPTLGVLGVKYKVSAGQIRNILINQETILKAFADAGESESEDDFDYDCLRAKEREFKLEILDKVVYEYLLRAVYHNEYKTYQQLQVKADEVKQCLSIKHFRPTYLWLKNFKKAHDIKDYAPESLRKEITFTEVKCSRMAVTDLLKYFVGKKKLEAAPPNVLETAASNGKELRNSEAVKDNGEGEEEHIEIYTLSENDEDKEEKDDDDDDQTTHTKENSRPNLPRAGKRRYRKKAKETSAEKPPRKTRKRKIKSQNKNLPNAMGTMSSCSQLSDEDSDHITIYKILDEGSTSSNPMEVKYMNTLLLGSKVGVKLRDSVATTSKACGRNKVFCENNEPKIIYTGTTADTVVNPQLNLRLSDIENQDLKSIPVNTTLIKFEQGHESICDEETSNLTVKDNQQARVILPPKGDILTATELAGIKIDDVIIKSEISLSPPQAYGNAAIHKYTSSSHREFLDNAVKLELTDEQMEFKVERPPSPVNEEDTANSSFNMATSKHAQYFGETTAITNNVPDMATPAAIVAIADESDIQNLQKECETDTAAKKRQRSMSTQPSDTLLENVLKYLKFVEDYAILRENYLAIGLVTQLEAVLKNAPKKD